MLPTMARRFVNPLFKIGKVLKLAVADTNVVEVKVVQLKMDDYLTQYFYHAENKLAVDNKNLNVRVGDLVLIQKTDQLYGENVEHELSQVLFKEGEVNDPVTGRRCRGTELVDDELRKKIREQLDVFQSKS